MCFSSETAIIAQSGFDPDGVDLDYYGKKHFLKASLMTAGINIGLWAFDRYALNADYAQISLNSIKDNFSKGFVWDNDQMSTNMFLHPYHGNLYFNAARSNGYNFWQSGLFALGGSAMWEFLMECEYPSTNDIITTPIGGMALGEVLYRTSDLILDDRSGGWERGGREVAIFILSPMRGVTRAINGDAWRKRTTTGRQFGVPNVSIEVATGVRLLKNNDTGIGFATELNFEYGNRYSMKQERPYDFFNLHTAINLQASQPIFGRLNIQGRLHNIPIIETDKTRLNLGVFQQFDYYDSDTLSSKSTQIPYKFCTPASLGIGSMFHNSQPQNDQIEAFGHITAIILGAVSSDYYKVDARNYNMASGISLKTGIKYSLGDDRFSLSLSHEYYRFYTWQGYNPNTDLSNVNTKTINVQGDHSTTSIHLTEATAGLKLHNNIYLSGKFSHISRHTHYRFHDDTHSNTIDCQLMLSLKL